MTIREKIKAMDLVAVSNLINDLTDAARATHRKAVAIQDPEAGRLAKLVADGEEMALNIGHSADQMAREEMPTPAELEMARREREALDHYHPTPNVPKG